MLYVNGTTEQNDAIFAECGSKTIATLTLNAVQRHAKGQSLMGQTIAKKGVLAHYVLGFETGSDIALTFYFDQLTHDNKLTQTSGALHAEIAA